MHWARGDQKPLFSNLLGGWLLLDPEKEGPIYPWTGRWAHLFHLASLTAEMPPPSGRFPFTENAALPGGVSERTDIKHLYVWQALFAPFQNPP